ncbi:hypothetical protein NDU88_005052 [Pleurodeles waltl]|uniref:Uncharacterized protein n=1 Tax=Pleurodeles waltl TaxID=8319 RepID=A0AAV7TUI7_PLEWA|nr:hypothetical protein NDU88_005052 [Pleurodeles waltl]
MKLLGRHTRQKRNQKAAYNCPAMTGAVCLPIQTKWRVDLRELGIAEKRLKMVRTQENAERNFEIWSNMLDNLQARAQQLTEHIVQLQRMGAEITLSGEGEAR